MKPGIKFEQFWRAGAMAFNSGKYQEACRAFESALRLFPGHVDSAVNLARCYQRLGRMSDAMQLYRNLYRSHPGHPDVCIQYARCLIQAGDRSGAVEPLTVALKHNPRLAVARLMLGNCLSALGDVDGAVSQFQTILGSQPGHAVAISSILFLSHYDPGRSDEDLHALHVKLGGALPKAATNPLVPVSGRPIRVGFLSPDLHEHSVVYFFEPLLRELNRDKVELFVFSDTRFPDATTARLKSYSSTWMDITGKPAEEVEKAVRSAQLDVLVDLAGHSSVNRIASIAKRLAPRQITYCGYPDTTGVAAMDYRIVDALTDPPGSERHATESLLRMERCFLCYQPPGDLPDPVECAPFERNGFVTFGSFNVLPKVNGQVLAVWAGILNDCPGSRLLVKSKVFADKVAVSTFVAKCVEAGIPSNRLLIRPPVKDTRGHLAVYNEVDIALDTFPYNGTTTTCEALAMGVPVVTFAGTRHSARVGASLLSAVGLPELCGVDVAGYSRIAAQLASDPERLRRIRSGLRARMLGSSLCDAPAFARCFEDVLASIVG